jgi:hypothetical protein
MTVAATIRQELEKDFLSTIRKGQDIVLGALKPLVQAVHYVITTMPVVRVPLARLLPAAHEAAADGHDFAEHLRANRREFADEVITATFPAAARQDSRKARSRQGRCLGSESTTPAGRADRRQRREPAVPGATVPGRSR